MEDGTKFIQITATSESDGKGKTVSVIYASTNMAMSGNSMTSES